MKKKLAVIFLSMIVLTSIAVAAYADVYSEKVGILEEYASLVSGKWELEGYTDWTSKWENMPTKISISKSDLSISADDRIYYQWDSFDYKTNGGELLLTLDKNKIGFRFEVNGITTIAYYVKAK